MSKYTTKHRAELPVGTLFAGLDLSLDTLVVVVLDGAGQRLDRFRASNHAEGYAYLRQRLQRTAERRDAPGTLIGMEPTNYYWKQVGYDLEAHHLPFRLVNALTVKRRREGDQLDRSKDDWRDAYTIADLLRTGKFTETHLPHGIYAELQTGYTGYWRLRQDRGRQVTLLINTVRQFFPEVEQQFQDLTGATAAARRRRDRTPSPRHAHPRLRGAGRARAGDQRHGPVHGPGGFAAAQRDEHQQHRARSVLLPREQEEMIGAEVKHG
jgi:transposase